MPDTKYKVIDPRSRRAPDATKNWNLAPNRYMSGHWTNRAYSLGDTMAPSSGRVVWRWNIEGSQGFKPTLSGVVGGELDTTDDLEAPHIAAPDEGPWKVLGRGLFHVTPGHYLRVRAVHANAGATQYGPADPGPGGDFYFYSGALGEVVMELTMSNRGSSPTGPYEVGHVVGPSKLTASGNLPQQAGGTWTELRRPLVRDVFFPADIKYSFTVPPVYSELTRYEVVLRQRGAPRLIDWQVAEVPRLYVSEHDAVSGSSYPMYVRPDSVADPPETIKTPYPMESDFDGDTYTEPRYGTAAELDALTNRKRRIGPMIMNWSAYRGDVLPVSSSVHEVFLHVSGNAGYQNILDPTGSVGWHVTGSGWGIPASYQKDHHTHGGLIIPDERASYADLLVRAYGYTDDDGIMQLRFQTTERSWHEVTMSNASPGWSTWRMRLEGSTAADDPRGTLQVFAVLNNWTAETSRKGYLGSIQVAHCHRSEEHED